MAQITRGARDKDVKAIKIALDEFEVDHPGAKAELYRQNSASIRIRIVYEKFARQSRATRHRQVFKYLVDRIGDDLIQELTVLLLLAPGEEESSWMNQEFEDPIKSRL